MTAAQTPKRGSIRRHIRRVDNHVCGKVEFQMKSRSTNDGTTYNVVVDPSDGSFSCDCPAGEFRPNTRCAHVQRAFNLLERHGELAPVIANLNGQGANIRPASQFKAPSRYEYPEGWLEFALTQTPPPETKRYFDYDSEAAPLSETQFDALFPSFVIDDEISELNNNDYTADMLGGLESRRAEIEAILKDTSIGFDDEIVAELDDIDETLEPYELFGWPLATHFWNFHHHGYCKSGEHVI